MGFKFWLTRYLKVFFGVAVLLFIVQMLKQHSLQESIIFSVIWPFITTSIFIGSRVYQSRKGVECALCNDTPNPESKNT
jgi:hypothetical protein